MTDETIGVPAPEAENVTNESTERADILTSVRRRKPSFVQKLNSRTAALYGVLSRTLAGRWLTSYRRGGGALFSGRPEAGAGVFRPLPPRRERVAAAMEHSRLLAAFRVLFTFMADSPALLYGLFFIVYGVIGIIIEAVGPFVWYGVTMDWERLLRFAVVGIGLSPLAFTKKSIAGVFGASALGRGLVSGFLGIPEDRLHREDPEIHAYQLYIVGLAAALCGAATIWIPPLLIPLCIGGLGFAGLILTYPETGVILSSLLLPVMWVWERGVNVTVGLLLLSWVGYGIQALSLHRTFHLGRLDGAVGVVGLILLLCTLCGAGEKRTGLVCVVLLSDYVLTVNLMNSHAHVRRCLSGALLSLLPVLLFGAARRIPGDFLRWAEGNWLGSILSDNVGRLSAFLGTVSVGVLPLLLVLLFPWLIAGLCNSRRPLSAAFWLLTAGLAGLTLADLGSVPHFVCAAVCLLVFFLLFSHKTVGVCLFALPIATGGVIAARLLMPGLMSGSWLSRLRDNVSLRLTGRVRLWQDVWQMIRVRPAGVGLGRDAFAAALASINPAAPTVDRAESALLDLVAALGWPGLCAVAVLVFLFWQKGITCLSVCRASADRAWIAAGLTTACAVGLYGLLNSLCMELPLFFTLTVLLGLCSAHQTIVFDEQNVLMAPVPGSALSEDRLIGRRV